MQVDINYIRSLIVFLGFSPSDPLGDIFSKIYTLHDNYTIKIDFHNSRIIYGSLIRLGDQSTSNFENSENFVVLECVDRLLKKGYPPAALHLEHKWPLGRKEKGKLDILVYDSRNIPFLMVECKTWGEELDKEKKKMLRDGGQLFSYYQQDKAAKFLCLYSSIYADYSIKFVNYIVPVESSWNTLSNQSEIFNHWNKNFKDNGVFDTWCNAYNVEIKSLTRSSLKEITEDDSSLIFNQFAEILRHNIVSDKPNAFNKIFNLFLCKIVDEDRGQDEVLDFQWYENDTDEKLQKRLSDLYRKGMSEYLSKEVTDYSDSQIDSKLSSLDSSTREDIKQMFTRVRLHKNNEFAFKEVYDEKSFRENALVVKEVVELLQPYQIRYGHKQQFLGDFFELLLSTGLKQEAGQFFTPVPIARFIVSSLPLDRVIANKLASNDPNFLPYIIDYAAGSGHFLTESMDEIQNIIQNFQYGSLKQSVKSKFISYQSDPFSWAKDFIYGIEADYRLVKTAKVSCFLNGDGLANVFHGNGLDHFSESTVYKDKLKLVTADNSMDNCQFDILVANPPYSVSAFKSTLPYGAESFTLYHHLSENSGEIECLFIERMKQLLKPGGYAGIILPSSILDNSGIYSNTRSLLLKYFKIHSIVSFGSNTFMATDTNTIAMFLSRRDNNDCREIERAITNFFNTRTDVRVSGIDNAIDTYISKLWPDIEYEDYISFLAGSPSDTFSSSDFYIQYHEWFYQLSEIKALKNKRDFKQLSDVEQNQKLDVLFLQKFRALESERILNFLLLFSQRTLLVSVGEKQAEKDFLGYEFSGRRGSEGIKMKRDEAGKLKTSLFDEQTLSNPLKVNFYIRQALLDNDFIIDASLSDNMRYVDALEIVNLSQVQLELSVSAKFNRSMLLPSIWKDLPLIKLGYIAKIQKGTSITKKKTVAGLIPVVAGGKNYAYLHNVSNRPGNIITVSASGANSGFVNFWTDPIFASDCITIQSLEEELFPTKLIYHYLKTMQNHIFDFQRGQAQPHVYFEDLANLEIPDLSPEEKEKILTVFNAREEEAIRAKELVDAYNNPNEAIDWFNQIL